MKDDFLIIDGSFGKWIDYENNRYKLAENICFRDPGEDSVPVDRGICRGSVVAPRSSGTKCLDSRSRLLKKYPGHLDNLR